MEIQVSSSIDSGVETGNDSNDSSATHDSLAIEMSPPRPRIPTSKSVALIPASSAAWPVSSTSASLVSTSSLPDLTTRDKCKDGSLDDKKDDDQNKASTAWSLRQDNAVSSTGDTALPVSACLLPHESVRPTFGTLFGSGGFQLQNENCSGANSSRFQYLRRTPRKVEVQHNPTIIRRMLDIETSTGHPYFALWNLGKNMDLKDCKVAVEHSVTVVPTFYPQCELQRKIRPTKIRFKNSFRDVWIHLKGPLAGRRLSTAASTNNVDMVRRLLTSGVDPNISDEYKRTPLHLAASHGYAEVVSALLAAGANPNQRDSLGNTPLHLAACTNHLEVVTLLLKAGTDVTSIDHYGRSPLQLAQSKLKLLQRVGSANSDHVKREVQRVVEMMTAYLQKKGQDSEVELLTAFANRLTLSQTQEQVDSDLNHLLASLNDLTIQKKDTT